MPDGYVPVQDMSLAAIEAEAVFARHVPEIAKVLQEQEEGRRVAGKVTLTLKIEIEQRQDGLALVTTGKLTAPGYSGRGVRGHLAPDGRVRIVGTPDQITIWDEPHADAGDEAH